MDLNSAAIHDVIHPTAAFSQRPRPSAGSGATHSAEGATAPPQQQWAASQLNPKNRIDSLSPPARALWRIDGCTGLGTQYYAVPLWLHHVVPLRVDVFIPEAEALSRPLLRRLLDLDVAFHAKSAARLRRLGVCSHILRALQHWTAGRQDEVGRMLAELPFGSRIVFRNLDVDVRRIRIDVLPMHEVERVLCSLTMLRSRWWWMTDDGSVLPPCLDLHELDFVRQLHDSVCVVRRRRRRRREDGGEEKDDDDDDSSSSSGGGGGEVYVLKALTSGSKYLYHELSILLSMPPHPYIISKPTHLVTKRCAFGNKNAVVGFLLPFHAGGNLTEEIAFLAAHGRLREADQLRWALQMTSAVVHAFETAGVFYPDLRLDNVVFTAPRPRTSSGNHHHEETTDTRDIVLLDFEQRGVWCEFGPPEVNAVEYVRILATDDDAGFHSLRHAASSAAAAGSNGDATSSSSDGGAVPAQVRARYVALLDAMLPGWAELQETRQYMPPGRAGIPTARSYNVAWECLDAAPSPRADGSSSSSSSSNSSRSGGGGPSEREAAQVYMLGRALWCVFEAQGAPVRSAAWQSYAWEPASAAAEFPAFARTPPALRPLLDACTRGRRDQLSRVVVRRRSKMMLADPAAMAAAAGTAGAGAAEEEQPPPAAVEAVLEAARDWWAAEIEYAEDFLRRRAEAKARGTWEGNYFGRPSLREVLAALEAHLA